MVGTEGCQAARWNQSQKTDRSRIAVTRYVKSESLVIADQHAAVNTFPGLVHRPSHHGSRFRQGGSLTVRGAYHGRVRDWGENRNKGSRRGNLRLDHSFLESIAAPQLIGCSDQANRRRVCSSTG